VSAHFDQYLSCHEAVRALSEDIKAHSKDNELLVSDMKMLKQVTDSTLSVMLQRAKEQRRIRNTIAVLNRFRPIFEITTKMKASLQAKDYDKLAEDYCRLKFHQTKANIAALQPALTAAHEIAKKANAELLKHFDDVSLSVKDQRRAITVLEALGITDKPIVACLLKQFSFLEAKLSVLQQSDSCDPSNVVFGSASVIYRFRSGLWGFICDVFKPSTTAINNNSNTSGSVTQTVTSAEAETIQQKAWAILSKATELIERNAAPPSAGILKQLNDTFREVNSLKKCTNATQLNANILQLKSSFCDKFRIKIVLQFVQQTFSKHSEQLMHEYFEPLISAQLLGSESGISLSAAANDTTPLPLSTTSSPTKVARLISEASSAFDEIHNTSMVSSESKVRLSRAGVLTVCSTDIISHWEYIWKQVSGVLLTMAEGSESGDGGSDSKTFRSVLVKEFKHQLHAMLSAFLTTLVETFIHAAVPPTTMASIAGSMRNRNGPGVCVLFAIVANCVELRERHLSTIESWFVQLAGSQSGASAELRQLLLDTEAKCMDQYVKMHSEPLLRILRAGSAEEAQQSRAALSSMPLSMGTNSGPGSRTESLRVETRTVSTASIDFGISVAPPTPTAIAVAVSSQNNIPQDSRQYVFNVLLQLITLRSEVETSLGHLANCHEYVRAVSMQLTAILTSYLNESVSRVEKASEPSEWRRIHVRSVMAVGSIDI
jgi:hypothetical protein